MTIGIAVSGPRAGLAAYRALRAVELAGRGAIGGFVSLAALNDGDLHRAECQRGGALALWDGADPPPEIAEARLVGLMSSGPDRPEPLSAFCSGDPAAGIVTGHRLPNMPGPFGVSPVSDALARLATGGRPEDAAARALALDPDGDAGLIVMDLSGRIGLAETLAVASRDDRGSAMSEHPGSGLRVGVLHNSIFPHPALAQLAVSVAFDTVAPADAVDAEASLSGLTVAEGPRRLDIDAEGRAIALSAPAAAWRGDRWEGSPVRRGDPVACNGRRVGQVVRECYAMAHRGIIVGTRGPDVVGWRWREAAK